MPAITLHISDDAATEIGPAMLRQLRANTAYLTEAECASCGLQLDNSYVWNLAVIVGDAPQSYTRLEVLHTTCGASGVTRVRGMAIDPDEPVAVTYWQMMLPYTTERGTDTYPTLAIGHRAQTIVVSDGGRDTVDVTMTQLLSAGFDLVFAPDVPAATTGWVIELTADLAGAIVNTTERRQTYYTFTADRQWADIAARTGFAVVLYSGQGLPAANIVNCGDYLAHAASEGTLAIACIPLTMTNQ